MTVIRKVASVLTASLIALTATADFASALTCTPMGKNVPDNIDYDGKWIISWQGYDCVVTLSKKGVFNQTNCNVSGSAVTGNATFKGNIAVSSACKVSGNFRIIATTPAAFNQLVEIKSATLRPGNTAQAGIVVGVAGYLINRLQLVMIQTQ